MFRPTIHMALHVFLPLLVAWFLFRKDWKKAWVIMVLTMVIDLDHLLANPIYDPSRCSIGFHPLHSYPAIAAYLLMAFLPVLRIVAVGLLLHIGLDFTDCVWMTWAG